MRGPTRPYGVWPELERIELGDRAARAYDEAHEVAYRVGVATGVARPDVPLHWQTDWRAA